MKPIPSMLAALTLALFLTGCQSTSTEISGIAPKTLIGRWESVSVSHPKFFGKPYKDTTPGAVKLDFHGNGQFTGKGSDEPSNGTFTIAGNKLTLKASDGEVSEWTFAITGRRLKLVDLKDGFAFQLERKE